MCTQFNHACCSETQERYNVFLVSQPKELDVSLQLPLSCLPDGHLSAYFLPAATTCDGTSYHELADTTIGHVQNIQ